MRLQIKAQHDSVSDSVRAYAEKRMGKLGKRLHETTLVELTFSRERNPSIAEQHAAEAIVYTKGRNLVARVSAKTYEAAVDVLVEKLERQIERYADKRRLEPRREAQRRAAAQPEAPLDVGAEGDADEAAA